MKITSLLIFLLFCGYCGAEERADRLNRIQSLFDKLRNMQDTKPAAEDPFEAALLSDVRPAIQTEDTSQEPLSEDEMTEPPKSFEKDFQDRAINQLANIEGMLEQQILGMNNESKTPVQQENQPEPVAKQAAASNVVQVSSEVSTTVASGTVYTVKPGDSLLLIARKIYLDPKKYLDIREWNDLKSDVLYPNQKLILKEVPREKKIEIQKEGNKTPEDLFPPQKYYYQIYKVRSGDSLSSIAQKLMGTQKKYLKLARFNGIDPKKYLFVGQKIIVPVVKED
jgi:LysM repeat protein